MIGPFCVTLATSEISTDPNRAAWRGKAMKSLVNLCAVVAAAATMSAVGSLAFAQNSPGVPGGILQQQFQLQEHPQLEFAASAPSQKYQRGISQKRKKGDLGDPDGCNLQCPQDTQ
jgi:hypothetical protein